MRNSLLESLGYFLPLAAGAAALASAPEALPAAGALAVPGAAPPEAPAVGTAVAVAPASVASALAAFLPVAVLRWATFTNPKIGDFPSSHFSLSSNNSIRSARFSTLRCRSSELLPLRLL